MITTSRRPSSRTRSLCKDLARVVANSAQRNRGKTSNEGLFAFALQRRASVLILIDSQMGNPSAITLALIGNDGSASLLCKFHISGVRLQREFKRNSKTPIFKKLLVVASEGDMELEKLGRVSAILLEGEFIETVDAEKLRHIPRDTCVLFITEENPDEIILKFMDVKLLEEYGPQIRIEKKNALTCSPLEVIK